MKKATLFLFFIVFLLTSCTKKTSWRYIVGGFDISQNDEFIIYQFVTHYGSSLCAMDLASGEVKLLLAANDSLSYFFPKFSNNYNKIAFVERKVSEAISYRLCVANPDCSGIRYLTQGDGFIDNTVFSDNDSLLIFIQAKGVSKGSPLVKAGPHGYDLYSVGAYGGEIKRLTHWDHYDMNALSAFDTSGYLMRITDGDKGGMFYMPKAEPEKLERIVPANNPRLSDLYYDPIYSKKENILAFTAPYQIYTMDYTEKYAKLLVDNRGKTSFSQICFYRTQNKLLFIQERDSVLYSISLDGTDLQKISVSLDVLMH